MPGMKKYGSKKAGRSKTRSYGKKRPAKKTRKTKRY
jgi:hypothetical protein